MRAVRADAADDRRQMEDHVWLSVGEQVEDGGLIAQIVVRAARHKHLARPTLAQRRDEPRPQKARAPGDEEAIFAPKRHRMHLISMQRKNACRHVQRHPTERLV